MENKDIIKYGLIIGGGGLAAWGLTRLANFKDTADKLSVNITRFDIDIKGLEYLKFLLNFDFVNPSNQAISLNIPSVKPYYGLNELGYSVPMKETKVINPKSITKVSNLELRVPLQNLVTAGLIDDIFQAISNQTAFIDTLKQKISFRIFAVVNGIEVSIEQRFGEEAKELGYIDNTSGVFDGLGLVAAGKRNIKDGNEYNYLFSKPKGTNELVQKDGSVEDTVIWCGWVVKTYHKDTEKLAEYLHSKSKDDKELYKNIFDFCYHHIQYHLDQKGIEQLRRPSVTWHDRKHGVDCDDYTMFIASILYNLGKPFEFRITKYSKPNYQHIYLIVPVGNGTHITIDPVLDTFNYEKPYSHKKDFDMKALNLAGTDENIGIPIEILAGGKPDNDLLKVVLGEDLKDTINGLGSTEDDSASMLRYLKRLRNVYVKNPDYIKDVQDPRQAVEMLDYAIKYWNTPKRDEAIQRLTEIEDGLIANGEIRLDGIEDDDEDWEEDVEFSGVEPELAGFEYKYHDDEDEWEDDISFTGTEPELVGFEYRYEEPEWEEDLGFTGEEPEEDEYEYDYSVDGLDGKRRRRRKKKRAKRRAKRKIRKAKRRARRKKKGGLFKRIGKGIKKGFKTVAKAIVKLNAAPIRLAFLAAMRSNMGKVADKLKYAYLTEQEAIAKGIEQKQYKKLKKAHGKVEKMFKKLGGSSKALKKAILSGKRKSLRGFEELNGGIAGIDELDGFLEDLDFIGTEPENPQYEYKYDNQVWETDEDFSGDESENDEYDYDYSFDGLDGRRLRFRKRKRVKSRFRRPKRRSTKIVRNKQVNNLFKQVNIWLKDINISSKNKGKSAEKDDFLKAFVRNYHNFSSILAYGYATESQIRKEGIDVNQWKKIKSALNNTLQLFKKELNGKESELKKAILLGKNKPALTGLGAAGAIAAAGSLIAKLIGKIVGWVKDIKVRKKAKKEAKKEFKESGGTSKEWRQSGEKRFDEQWAAQIQNQATQDKSINPDNDFSELIANQMKSGADQNYLAPQNTAATKSFNNVQSTSLSPMNNSVNQTGNLKESAIKLFLKKHKKKLLIGGGIIGTATLAYFTLRPKNEAPKKKQTNQKNKGVSGTKSKPKAKPKAGKIKEVKLS